MPQDNSSVYTVALVGRPNVGKSTLFNRLLKKRRAVVSESAGTTRDRLKEQITVPGHTVLLMDMAGIEPALSDSNDISQGMQQQVEQALKEAAVIVWVVDGITGITNQDAQVAELLRRLGKPVILAVNKCDHPSHDLMLYEFSRFGFENAVPISSLHNRGVQPLLVAIGQELDLLPPLEKTTSSFLDVEERELRLAIVGRPNVGKSTLLNTLSGEDRAVVSPISGTTRDSVDTLLEAKPFFGKTFTRFQQIRIIDTAGIRQRSKMGHTIEAWSVLRSLDTVDQAHIVLLVIDALEGMTHQDLVVAERILDAGRPLIIVANKWDAYLEQKEIIPGTTEADKIQEVFQSLILGRAPFLAWAQLIVVSAKTGLHIPFLSKVVLRGYEAWSHTYDQTALDALSSELKKTPRLKDLKQIIFEHAAPPVFIVHMGGFKLPHFTTRRYIERALRDYLEIGPTPIKLWIQLKEKRKPSFRDK